MKNPERWKAILRKAKRTTITYNRFDHARAWANALRDPDGLCQLCSGKQHLYWCPAIKFIEAVDEIARLWDNVKS